MMYRHFARFSMRLMSVACLLLFATGMLMAQTTSTGAITGTVTDPSGAAVPNATVLLTQQATGAVTPASTTSTGKYTFTALQPGTYQLSAVAKGFSTSKQTAVVRVNQMTNAPFKLQIGSASQTVEVSSSAGTVQVDTTTAVVGGTISSEQIKNLPNIGRNFLALAQLQPGVQLIDGGNFDPTKNGFAGLSVQGAEGRTTEINVNGADITDQTVGTTVMNLSSSSIHGFQVSQSSGDTSSDVGNTGQVNITTASGTNQWHGEGFAAYRSARFSANPTLTTVKPPFKQNQDGLSLGGPLVHNKLFFYVNGERQDQDAFSSVNMPDFAAENGFFQTPGFDKTADVRIDWTITPNFKAFYYFAHDSNRLIPPSVIGGTNLQPFTNEDVSNMHDFSATYTHGNFTHTLHFDHLAFQNHIYSQAVAGAPNIPIGINFDTGESFGPNLLAPQHTYQYDDEFKYDGSFSFGNHTLRYGAEFNKISNLVYAAFFASGPQAFPSFAAGPIAGSAGDPTSYAPDFVIFGNGQGYFSNLPLHGDPYGGVHNLRQAYYFADTWRATPNLTINYGVHFERDPGEVNTDLAHPVILGQAFPTLAHAATIPNNFSPTMGIAWDPSGKGTWVIRAGAGMYYQNDIWNNVMFERSNYISAAIAPAFPLTFGQPVLTPQGNCVFMCPGQQVNGQAISLSSMSIAQLTPAMEQAQSEIFAAYAAFAGNISSSPATILGNPGVSAPGTNIGGNPLFDSTYRTPYSVQMNLGVEHQLAPGAVLSANYVFNRGSDLLVIQDLNNVGDARFLNQSAAINAINGAAADLGVAQGATPQATVQNMIDAATPSTANPSPAFGYQDISSELMGTSGGYSLGSGPNNNIGQPINAFGGKNPDYGNLATDRNGGISEYRALQLELRLSNLADFGGVKINTMTVSYALGRLDANQFSGSFAGTAGDNINPRMFYGPEGYDRTSQLSVGGVFSLPWGVQIATVNHFETGFPVTPRLGNSTGIPTPGRIFQTDWTGDGTTGDVIPGANLGAFNRTIGSATELQKLIDNYNTNNAGTDTPAGQALLRAGLMNQTQLTTLGLVMPYIGVNVNPHQIMPDSFMDTDLTLKKNIGIGDRLTVTPEIDAFNLFNIGNYDPPGNGLSGSLPTSLTAPLAGNYGSVGSITNTTYLNQPNKFGLNTGVFAGGIPRAFQGQITFTF